MILTDTERAELESGIAHVAHFFDHPSSTVSGAMLHEALVTGKPIHRETRRGRFHFVYSRIYRGNGDLQRTLSIHTAEGFEPDIAPVLVTLARARMGEPHHYYFGHDCCALTEGGVRPRTFVICWT